MVWWVGGCNGVGGGWLQRCGGWMVATVWWVGGCKGVMWCRRRRFWVKRLFFQGPGIKVFEKLN